MKTPEEVAAQIVEAFALLKMANASGYAVVQTIAAIIAERDKRADALAVALREIMETGYGSIEGLRVITATSIEHEDCCEIALKALAAYDAEAK